MPKIFEKNKTVQIFITSLIIFAMFAPSFFIFLEPKEVKAALPIPLPGVPINNLLLEAHDVEEFSWRTFVKEALMMAARKLINKLTQNIVNWINTGFHGNPFYIENPKSFFKDIVKYEVRTLADIYGYDRVKFPFGKSFIKNTVGAYQRQLEDNASYSLSKIIDDPLLLERYRTDFDVGGWDGFLINTQYPQNNYVGFYLEANEELARRIQGTSSTVTQKIQDTLQKSQGFLAPQTCPSNPKYNNLKNEFLQKSFDIADYNKKNPNQCDDLGTFEERVSCTKAWTAAFEKAKATWEKDNACPGGLVTTTPGSIVGAQIKTALESKIRQTELAAAMGNSFSAIVDAFLNVLINKGLKALNNRPPDPVAGKAGTPEGGGTGETPGEVEPVPLPPTGPAPTSLEADLIAERAKYGSASEMRALCSDPSTGDASQGAPEGCPLGAILNAVAWKNKDAGWGLNFKDFGEHCPSPAGKIACDILHHKPSNIMYDVFLGVVEEGNTGWSSVGTNTNSGRPWVAPVAP